MRTMASVQSTRIATTYTRESNREAKFLYFDLFSRYELPVHDVDDDKTALVVFYHR